MPQLRKYPFLSVNPGVDWKDVNPELLTRLNRLGRSVGQVIEIFSGYRPPGSPYGFAGDPHQRHIAVDARINGRPIGLVIAPTYFAKVGLRSGNQPGFYKGKPDPSHVDLVGYQHGAAPSGTVAAGPPDVPPQPQEAQATTTAVTAPATGTPPAAQDPAVELPGTAQHYLPGSGPVADSWQTIAQLPDLSPDTQRLIQLASG